MGGLAKLLIESGHEVSGSDIQFYPPMSDHLNDLKINLIQGYSLDKLPNADLYVIGNALSRGNESVEHILNNRLPFKSGPEMLGEVLRNRKVFAVSGTHGKTTTSYMLTHIFLSVGKEVGYLVGGVSNDIKGSASLGRDEIFVIEADEYDSAFFDKRSKFIHYSPDTLVINNIEFDHADIYENIEMIEKNFLDLIVKMPRDSEVLINSNKVRQSFKDSLVKLDIKAKLELFELDCSNIQEENKQLACKALASKLTKKQVLASLDDYGGVKRRFETIYENSDFKVIDDFAHHPTAIEETLTMAKKENPNIELIIELGSNSMRKGIHDDRLIEIFSDNTVYTINASEEQQKKFSDSAIELNLKHLEKICSKDGVKKTILMCGNRNFQGFQQLIIDKLIK